MTKLVYFDSRCCIHRALQNIYLLLQEEDVKKVLCTLQLRKQAACV